MATGTVTRAFTRFFTDAATPVNLREDRTVMLDDLSRVLLVEHGALDLFAVRRASGRPGGRWKFLCRVEAGTLLLGCPPGPRHTLIARGVPRTVVSWLPIGHLQGLSARRAGSDGEADRAARALSVSEYAVAIRQLVGGIEKGIVALAGALRSELAPRDFVPLHPDGITEVAAGRAVRSIDGLHWVTVESGSVQMAETVAGTLTAGASACLTERDWLISQTPAELRTRSTADELAAGTLWSRVITHATRFHYSVDRRIEAIQHAEQADLERRAGEDSRLVTAAARNFDMILQDTRARVRLADVAGDPAALAAVRLVAARLGFSADPPPSALAALSRGLPLDPVQHIAMSCGIRTRQVKLDDDWWRADLGPMIGYLQEEHTPVALLPDRGGYVMALPGQQQVTRVGRDTRQLLRPDATVIYQPLPEAVGGVRQLLRFGMRNNRADLWRLGITAALVAGIGLLVPILTGQVLGTFVERAQKDLIVEGGLLVIGSAFVAAAFQVVQNIAALRLEGRWSSALQAAVWGRLLSLPASFFSKYATGELGTMALGVSAAQEVLSSLTTTAALGALTGAANLILVYFYNVRLAVIATVLVLIGAGVCVVVGIFEVRWQRKSYKNEQRLSARVFQLLGAVPKLRVTAAEDRAFAVWADDFGRGRVINASARRLQNVVTTFNAGYPLLCAVVVFWLVGGVMHDNISTSTFLGFFAAFNLLLGSTLQFTGVAVTALRVVPMLERLEPLLTAKPEVKLDRADPGELSGQISFSRISFSYGGQDGPMVLDEVSFAVEPGEFVAIVGPTGCGKSTILRLLLGFETPQSGTVLYDGQDVGQLDIGAVRRQCGVVLQNGALLAGDLLTNIVGSTSYTQDDAWEAARMAGMADEIRALPMGLHTVVSEGTNTLSGGQRQRVMIARALVSRPRIVLFDEATSALDNPTQEVVAASTRELNATRIVIAHRLSTVTDADRILVMEAGRIVQQGTYSELMAEEDGLFATLASAQL
jgi:NHLM bacteriocin system ABC transporter ATP-binding protein